MTDIWLVVRVPVLSEQMTVVQPSVSTDGSFLHRHRLPWAPTNTSTCSRVSVAGKHTLPESQDRRSAGQRPHRIEAQSAVKIRWRTLGHAAISAAGMCRVGCGSTAQSRGPT